MLGQCSACAAGRPTSARFEPARRFRGFHHWFTARCTVLPCLPDPARLAVPDRPVVVRAAPTLPGASQAGLPPASTGLLRQPTGGSFHPTRSHGASWRTPLSAWTWRAGRRRPAGVLIGGMSSTTAWNMVVSLTLAAVTTAVSGSRCRRRPGGACFQAAAIGGMRQHRRRSGRVLLGTAGWYFPVKG
jgi:hypothetical protein